MGIRYFNTMNVFMRRIIILLLLTSILSIAVSAQTKMSQHDNKVPEAAIVWAGSELWSAAESPEPALAALNESAVVQFGHSSP